MMLPWLQATREAFEAAVRSGRIPHAVLVTGPAGSGKLAFARLAISQLLCRQEAPGGCGKCRSCTMLVGGAHPDFREVTFEINPDTGKLRDVITVPQVRALIDALYKTTTAGTRKAALIHPAESMNRNAANALLKTLEEPAGDAVIVLVACDPSRLPVTVLSRCQRLEVHLPPARELVPWVAEAAGNGEDAAAEALDAAAGSPLNACAMLGDGGIGDYRKVRDLLDALRGGRVGDGRAVEDLAELEQGRLWTWLSLGSARLLREGVVNHGGGGRLRRLAELQQEADRNRMLSATPVRKDLLLRDWLIQWKQL